MPDLRFTCDVPNSCPSLPLRDMIAGYLATAEKLDDENVNGEAFNFGGAPMTLKELITAVIRAWNAETGEARTEMLLITGPRVDSVKSLDMFKAKRVLDWQPQMD